MAPYQGGLLDEYTIIIAGTGETSRANVEALIDDYIYSHGQGVTFAIVYDKKPSQGQVFAAQFAKIKNKDIIVFCNDGATFDGIPSSPVVLNEPLPKWANSVAFVLIDDEDSEQYILLSQFHKSKVDMYDLTEGLIPIKYDAKFKKPQEPVIPEAEQIMEENLLENAEEFLLEIEEEQEEQEESEDPTLDELEDEAYFGMMAFAKMIAKLVVKEIQKSPEGVSE